MAACSRWGNLLTLGAGSDIIFKCVFWGWAVMPFKRLQAAKEKSVGSKQTVKALKKNLAKVVYVAVNADEHVAEPVIEFCKEKKVPVVQVDSMRNLGKACGIKVECATAAIIED